MSTSRWSPVVARLALLAPVAVGAWVCSIDRPDRSELPQAAFGEWAAVRSTGGWTGDTVRYSTPSVPMPGRPSWRLTFRKDSRYVSHWDGGETHAGHYTVSIDTMKGSRHPGSLLVHFPQEDGSWPLAMGDYFPRVVGDTLYLDTAWTDSKDHVFVRVRQEERP